jgi:hypothetical protein
VPEFISYPKNPLYANAITDTVRNEANDNGKGSITSPLHNAITPKVSNSNIMTSINRFIKLYYSLY